MTKIFLGGNAMTAEQLSQELNISATTIKTNFPSLKSRLLKKGIEIIKEGIGKNADYSYRTVEPQTVDKSVFSKRAFEVEQIENEKWIPSYLGKDLEISNMGRYRWTSESNHYYRGGAADKSGYLRLTYKGKSYRVHRVVLQSFNPIDDYKNYTVDHINGIYSDNRLENLRWATNEENIMMMMINRVELNKELTRLIQIHGYDDTLKILQQLQ